MSNFFTGFLAKGSGSATFVEINYPGYARQPVTFGPMANGETGNVDAVTFTAAAPWLPVTQDALFDASGNALLWWNTSVSVTLGAGQSLNIPPGAIQLFFAAVASSPGTTLQIASGAVPAIKPGGLSVTALTALQVANGALSVAAFGSVLDTATGYKINGKLAIIPAANGGLPSLSLGSQTVAYDIASGPGNIRQNTIYGDINASVDTGTIWQNFFTSTTLAGPGAANGEITQVYSGFVVNAGATSAQAETIELRLDNSGTIGVFDAALSTLHNLAGATAGTIRGSHYALSNDNATAGSISNYIAIQIDPLSGAGSEPSYKMAIRNSDPNAGIATLGNVNIGTIAQPLATRLLNIIGPDAVDTTTPVFVSNNAGARLFSLGDAGGAFFGGGITLGGPTPTGFGTGNVQINGATSGFVRLVASGPVLSSVNVTIPNATGTLALLSSAQNWSALQVFKAHVAGAKTTTLPVITNGTIDATGSDLAGTITGGTTVTGITVTFETAYATTPHAVVSARDGVTFTYTVSTTALTLTFASATGRIFDYHVIQ